LNVRRKSVPPLAGAALTIACAVLAPSAHGALLYTTVDRSVSATVDDFAGPSDSVSESSADTAAFDESVGATGGTNRADATQLSSLGAHTITGAGSMFARADSGFSTSRGESRLSVDFTLTLDALFELSGEVVGSIRPPGFRTQDNGRGEAGLTLATSAGDVLFTVFEPEGIPFDTGFAESGFLAAGDYTLTAFATGSGSYSTLSPFSSGRGEATARFAFEFVTEEAPAGVPGPAVAGLLAGPVLAIGLRRRRRG
jgi:hypothetical protein